jgi:GDPmannose 4,6-dehydratase
MSAAMTQPTTGRKALVFGINSMDGRTLTHLLLAKGYQVVGTFRRNTLNLKDDIAPLFGNSPALTFEYCDVADFGSVKQLVERHTDAAEAYLLAAQSHVGFSFSSSDVSVLTNGMSVYNLLENLHKHAPKVKAYFAGTSELFGGADPEHPYNEDSPYDCRSPYSIGKELGTRWLKYYRQLGLFACYGILFNHSNCYRSADFYVRRVTQSAARIALGKQQSVSFGFLGFSRDEHWADFGCEMMWKMLQRETPQDYVIANGVTHAGEEFLDLSFGHFNLRWQDHVTIDQSRFRINEVVKLIGDSTRAQRDLDWVPNRMPFEDHIALMCRHDYALEQGQQPVRPDVFALYPVEERLAA